MRRSQREINQWLVSCAGEFGCVFCAVLIVVTPGPGTPFVSAAAEMQNPDRYNGDH